MKKRVIVDLILSHYKDDDHTFFRRVLDVLKEFRDNGEDNLANMIEFEIRGHLTVLPKKKEEHKDWHEKIEFEDAKEHYLVKDGDLVKNWNFHPYKEDAEVFKEELSSSDKKLIEDICNIDVDGCEKHTKNSKGVGAKVSSEGIVTFYPTNNEKEMITPVQAKKLFKGK